ncbi:hypothetical protein B9Z19DRAFT_1100097 [Tuber borchii]|uniref:Phenylalanyl-tRNA synthetase domain-containing protein n=1 Tax=Tuber borchii TaxID=42251 RepID=A0A2T6ZZ61_TUBBO|nr:hypothetical protein B9Z19DRAFT_1100097 [Tuber borchii]
MAPTQAEEPQSPPITQLEGRHYPIDEWTNFPLHISSALSRKLHLQPSHPLSLTRRLIESRFPGPTYEYHNDLSPRVSLHQNLDSPGFPIGHRGRSRTDHCYVNKETILRTFTSAHQADTLRSGTSDDMYRLGAIDRSHYPVFHQMEGHWIDVEDPNPPFYEKRNPLQVEHTPEEWRAISAHLKGASEEPLRVRWVEAYFPFRSHSWEPNPVTALLFGIPDIGLSWSLDQCFLEQFMAGEISRLVPF